MSPNIFEHITTLDPSDFLPLDDMDASDTLAAQATTVDDFLTRMGSPELAIDEQNARQARQAFAEVTDVRSTDLQKKQAVLALRVPQAVKHLAGMLSNYDWDYVEQAKELRGFVVAKLLEEVNHPDAKIRLRALNLIGNLTEVGSFTERIEITKKDASSQELEDRLRSKLAALLPKVVEVQTVETKPSSTP